MAPTIMLRRFLFLLERLPTVLDPILGMDVGTSDAIQDHHHWLVPDGHLTHVMVPFLDSEEEVEVEADADAKTYTYRSPQQHGRIVTRPLDEIAIYRIHLDAVLDHVTALLKIRPTATTQRRCLVSEHLWYLGALRIGTTQVSVSIFYGRALQAAPDGVIVAKLADPLLGDGGIVLTPVAPEITLPLRRELRAIDDLLYVHDGQELFNLDALGRILSGMPADAGDFGPEWFDEASGRLMLRHLAQPVTFKGYQKKIISIFWKARDGAPLRWTEDVMAQSGSSLSTLDKAMGGREKRELCIDRLLPRGNYRLRRQ